MACVYIFRLCCFSRCDILSDFSEVLVMYLLNSVSSVHYFLSLCHFVEITFYFFVHLQFLVSFLKSYVHSMILECNSSADTKPSWVHANSTYRDHLC